MCDLADSYSRSRHNPIWILTRTSGPRPCGRQSAAPIPSYPPSALLRSDGDIIGDAASFGENETPKLLMVSSLGTLSETWAKGLGSAGGVLGCIKLRGGLSLWDANAWHEGFLGDAQVMEADGTAFNGVQVLARRARISTGYFPDPSTLVASNGFYASSDSVRPSVLSGVITEDSNGLPIAYAAMGYSEGLLTLIDGKVGQPESKATFMSGGPKGMDGRIHDLSFGVNNEHANVVEVLKGTWQGPSGTEQGTLLLVATDSKFWVLKPSLTNVNSPGVTQYAYYDAKSIGRITRIVPDAAQMLVGVEANKHVWVFDLNTLQPTYAGPVVIAPIYDFDVTGAWTLADGMVYTGEKVQNADKLTIRDISSSAVACEDPSWNDPAGSPQAGSGVWIKNLQVELANLKGETVLSKVALDQCAWLLISEGYGTLVAPNATSLQDHSLQKLRLYLKPGTKPVGSGWVLRVWGADVAGNPMDGVSLDELVAGKFATVMIYQKEWVP